MISVIIILCGISLVLGILLVLSRDDDWPDDRHLDPPRGGTA